jgi:hypothetical protein
VTALGRLTVARTYFTCPACGLGAYALDQRLGIDGALSRQARRVVCWAGGRMAFAQAAEALEQLGGWTISDETIRQVCQAEAAAIAAWRSDAEAAAAGFRRAEGLPEFQTDAAKVNTDTGWRDVKIGIFAKRPAGEPAAAADWEDRELPRPTARVAFAAIEPSEAFGARWRPWAERLGLHDPTALSVLADGAEWIWDQVALQFPGAAELIDIYHASEHLSDAGKALFGAGTEGAAAWLEAGRQRLLSDGWWGLCEQIGQALVARPDAACQAAMDELTTYFSKHTARLDYAHRLHTGRSIGSGMVEGAAKNLIGKRLKQTGARWKVGNVPKMGELCCLTYSEGWSEYWDEAA